MSGKTAARPVEAGSPGEAAAHLLRTIACCAAFACVAGAPAPARGDEPSTPSLERFLAEREIDLARRQVFEGEWDVAKQEALIRVLARLNAPSALEMPWHGEAIPLGATVPAIADRFVRVQGRATFVAPQSLTPDEERLAGRPQFDVVRIVDAEGVIVDVVMDRAPKAWPRWQPIDEPAGAVGLPLALGAGPRPSAADGRGWPEPQPGLLLAATGISWTPPTPLGGLGMDYGLFERVVDGSKLQPGDTEAFYALLAAVGRAAPGAIEAEAGRPADIVPIIDPAQKWFAGHRGDPLTIEGVARRATRIAVDEPFRREQVGADHYWELFVFVNTPLIEVHGRKQTDYPIVCCVRDLPSGFPTGDRISETVRVSGFAFKRYGYPLPGLLISSSQEGDKETKGQRMETALVVGRDAVWVRQPSTAGTSNALFSIFSALAAVVGLALAYGAWSMRRDRQRTERRARAELPDRIRLPDDVG